MKRKNFCAALAMASSAMSLSIQLDKELCDTGGNFELTTDYPDCASIDPFYFYFGAYEDCWAAWFAECILSAMKAKVAGLDESCSMPCKDVMWNVM